MVKAYWLCMVKRIGSVWLKCIGSVWLQRIGSSFACEIIALTIRNQYVLQLYIGKA